MSALTCRRFIAVSRRRGSPRCLASIIYERCWHDGPISSKDRNFMLPGGLLFGARDKNTGADLICWGNMHNRGASMRV
jgi:hypothetical protein